MHIALRAVVAIFIGLAGLLNAADPVRAGQADVVAVQVTPEPGGTFRFDVSIRHTDEGWDHYADGWEILGPSAIRLGYRKLWHPHVNEQPFTRSLSGVRIPLPITHVKIRAHDKVHGFGGQVLVVAIPR